MVRQVKHFLIWSYLKLCSQTVSRSGYNVLIFISISGFHLIVACGVYFSKCQIVYMSKVGISPNTCQWMELVLLLSMEDWDLRDESAIPTLSSISEHDRVTNPSKNNNWINQGHHFPQIRLAGLTELQWEHFVIWLPIASGKQSSAFENASALQSLMLSHLV